MFRIDTESVPPSASNLLYSQAILSRSAKNQTLFSKIIKLIY